MMLEVAILRLSGERKVPKGPIAPRGVQCATALDEHGDDDGADHCAARNCTTLEAAAVTYDAHDASTGRLRSSMLER